jgi:hypothetical protein
MWHNLLYWYIAIHSLASVLRRCAALMVDGCVCCMNRIYLKVKVEPIYQWKCRAKGIRCFGLPIHPMLADSLSDCSAVAGPWSSAVVSRAVLQSFSQSWHKQPALTTALFCTPGCCGCAFVQRRMVPSAQRPGDSAPLVRTACGGCGLQCRCICCDDTVLLS